MATAETVVGDSILVRGIGVDIVKLERIEAVYRRFGERFAEKVLSEEERSAEPVTASVIAKRFAAKEAIAKALGVGFGAKLGWLDIEVLNNELGAPLVTLSKNAQESFNNPHLLLSISHGKSVATAVAIWVL